MFLQITWLDLIELDLISSSVAIQWRDMLLLFSIGRNRAVAFISIIEQSVNQFCNYLCEFFSLLNIRKQWKGPKFKEIQCPMLQNSDKLHICLLEKLNHRKYDLFSPFLQPKSEVWPLIKTLWKLNLFQFCVHLLEVYPSTFLWNSTCFILELICSCNSAVMAE